MSGESRIIASYRIEGEKHACERLKNLVRTTHAQRSAKSLLADQILEAVEALPDTRKTGSWTKFDQLPSDIQLKLRTFLEQAALSYHATALKDEIEARFPELRREQGGLEARTDASCEHRLDKEPASR